MFTYTTIGNTGNCALSILLKTQKFPICRSRQSNIACSNNIFGEWFPSTFFSEVNIFFPFGAENNVAELTFKHGAE